jgi:uncharacterized protein YaiI (UPF0178 family)
MILYIDADALPNLLKPTILKSIKRLKLQTVVISNKKIDIGDSEYISYKIVGQGIDKADNLIAEMAKENDLIITSDIPLADRVIEKRAFAIDHRGTFYDKNNIKSSLAIRNLMEQIRDSGEKTKGPAPFSKKDTHNFATTFNNFLAKILK